MTPKNNKFYAWKEYFSFFQNKDKKMSLLRLLVKEKPKTIWICLNPINKLLLLLPKSRQTKILLRVFLHKRNQVIHVLLKFLPKSKIYSNFFCLGPLVWIQFILLMLSFFHAIGLGAVDYEMVDSTIRKKPSKTRDTYKVYSDKDHFSNVKNASIYGTMSTVRRWKKIYLYINESTVHGFKKFYEAQIKDEIRKKKSPKTVIVNKLRGRPCLLGNKIDPLVQKYLKATRYKRWVVNTMVEIGTNKTILTLRERPSWIRKILGSKPFPPPWFCSPYENHWQSEDSSRSSKRSRIEVLTSNRQ